MDAPLPPASGDPRTARFAELCAIMERLRRPGDGCPWDLEQTLETLLPFVREELDEADQAARAALAGEGPTDALREELGDLLFNVVFTVELCRERGWFGMGDVVAGAAEKIVRRHPHIFGDETAATADEVGAIWQRVKAEEAARRAAGGGQGV